MAERFSPLDTSLTGQDGVGKDTAIVNVLDHLFKTFGDDLKVVRLDRPPMYIWQDKSGKRRVTTLFLPIFKVINNLHKEGDKKGDRRLVQVANAMNVLMQGRVVRPMAQTFCEPSLYLSGRNYFTDPAAYAQFYAPELKGLSIEDRLRFMKKVSGLPDYNQIYFMKLPPEVSFQRIEARLEGEKVKPTGQPSWRHKHETIEGLQMLSQVFDEVPRAVANVFPNTELIMVDAMQSKEQVAMLIGDNIARGLSSKVINAEHSKKEFERV